MAMETSAAFDPGFLRNVCRPMEDASGWEVDIQPLRHITGDRRETKGNDDDFGGDGDEFDRNDDGGDVLVLWVVCEYQSPMLTLTYPG